MNFFPTDNLNNRELEQVKCKGISRQRLARTLLVAMLMGYTAASTSLAAQDQRADRPNVLIAISDDQSFPHTSAYDCRFVSTPGFDQVAREGTLFRNVFASTPGCSPSRASLLTGLQAWQIRHAGTHASLFPQEFPVFPELLESEGYWVGATGKGWGPGNWRQSERPRNPVGPQFQSKQIAQAQGGISRNDYAANFADFLSQRPDERPFCFWYGGYEPHRGFERGAGLRSGKDLADVDVPAFLPDHELVRSDLLDYAHEIEWFDQHLVRMLEMLDEIGERDNTIVIVTSDNGMAFPRAKANLYESGIHVPLAISWPNHLQAGQVADDVVGFVDVTSTILDACQIQYPERSYTLAGTSLIPLLVGDSEEVDRVAYSARERHSSSRYRSLGYPQRSIRTDDYLLIRNFRPERWPAGAPQKIGSGGYPNARQILEGTLGPMHGGYHDIDACPTLSFLIEQRDHEEFGRFLGLAVDRRPSVELFDIRQDPACLENLAESPEYQTIADDLLERLQEEMLATGDPRATGDGDVFETYERFSGLRYFPEPDWVQDDVRSVPDQPWWTARFPKIEEDE